jgi:hypothetical protein
MNLSDRIDWDNMPDVPSPLYPRLVEQIRRCNAVAREEGALNESVRLNVLGAFDCLRVGINELTHAEIPPLSSVTEA